MFFPFLELIEVLFTSMNEKMSISGILKSNIFTAWHPTEISCYMHIYYSEGQDFHHQLKITCYDKVNNHFSWILGNHPS